MEFRQLIMSLEDTRRIGRALACCIARENPSAILFYGEMGAGKTTLIRAIVEALPGGHEAEVSSPSFTISNIYETVPEVRHFDLYRMQAGCADESLLESFDEYGVLTIVEWPERLRATCLPPDGLKICLGAPGHSDPGGEKSSGQFECRRNISIAPLGEKGRKTMQALQAAMARA